MEMLVKAIGILIIAAGLMVFLNPQAARKMMVFWRQGKNLYLGGLIRLLLGGILLYYMPQARLPQVIFALGVLALVGGLLIFVLGLEKLKGVLGWWDKKPDSLLRLLSLLVFAFGALIIYSV